MAGEIPGRKGGKSKSGVRAAVSAISQTLEWTKGLVGIWQAHRESEYQGTGWWKLWVSAGTLEELVMNREEGKKLKVRNPNNQPHHRLDSFHFLSAKWAELFQVTTKQKKKNKP